MDPNTVLTAIRQELVTAGLVRLPGVAGALPPMHVEPIDGAPAPGDREAPEDDATLVTTLTLDGLLSEAPFDDYRRRHVALIDYRSKTTAGLKRARVLDAAIYTRLLARADHGLGWTMGGTVLVLQTTLYAGLSPVSRDPGAGYHDSVRYVVEVQTA